MRRRTLLMTSAAAAGAGLARLVSAQGTAAGLPVDIVIGNEPPDRVVAILQEVGAEQVRPITQRGLGGMDSVVAAVVLAKGLANVVMRLLDDWQCGIKVDARASRILTEKDCALPRGTVVVIGTDGTRTTLSRPSLPEIQSLAEKIGAPR